MAQATKETERSQASHLTEKQRADAQSATPNVDVYENQDEILLVADLPGVSVDELDINLDGSELVIQGTQEESPVASGKRLSFSRSFRVPQSVEPQGVKAELRQGVLMLHLTKSEASKPRRIEVSAN